MTVDSHNDRVLTLAAQPVCTVSRRTNCNDQTHASLLKALLTFELVSDLEHSSHHKQKKGKDTNTKAKRQRPGA
jgi:hypothetical protein